MGTRAILSASAALVSALLVAVIAVERADGTTSAGPSTPGITSSTSAGPGSASASAQPTAGSGASAGTGQAATAATADAYPPPRNGRYTYDAPGGSTTTTVTVRPTGPGAWEVDESIAARAGVVQARHEAWTPTGARVLGVWEASQPQPCMWSTPPLEVVFPLRAGSTWSVDATCRVSHGKFGTETTRVQGSFRTSERTTLTIGGRSAVGWLVVGNEVTTSDGTVNGHRYHTVDRTTTKVWFLPSVGLPGRTALTGTVTITSDKGTVRHPISQVTQLESLTPQ